MVRVLAITGIVSLVAAIGLIVAGRMIPLAVVLLLASAAISAVLAAHRGYRVARTILREAGAFVSGDVQRARIADVSDPEGFFFPKATVGFELVGEDEHVHRFEREVPVPFPAAWSYRLGKRFRLPVLSSIDLGELLAVELRRDGFNVSVGRGDDEPATPAPATGSA